MIVRHFVPLATIFNRSYARSIASTIIGMCSICCSYDKLMRIERSARIFSTPIANNVLLGAFFRDEQADVVDTYTCCFLIHAQTPLI